MSIMPITGTFIDEMTVDIPSQNWGRAEWAAEFDRYVTDAIDTVILIRCGCGPRLAFPSKTVAARVPTLPVYVDLVELLLDLAAERGIDFYFGLYDSNVFWYRYDWRTEVDLNRELTRMEVRLKQAKKEGDEQQIARIENRLKELKQAAETKAEAAANPGALAIDESQLIRQAYLRTLTRLPTADELDRCTQHLAQAESPLAGAKAVLWALVNTKEFIVNH